MTTLRKHIYLVDKYDIFSILLPIFYVKLD